MHTSYVPFAPFGPVPVPDRRALRATAAAAMAVVLLLLAVQGWLPQAVANETVLGATSQAGTADRTGDGVRQAERAGIDVDGAIEEAMHTPTPIGADGTLEASDPAYKTTFDRTGFTYRSVAGGELDLQTTSLSRGTQTLPVQQGAWSADGDVARRDLSPGVQEQVTNGRGEIEWDVVLAHRPAGRGAFRVGADIDGTQGAPVRTEADGRPAWRLRLAGGGSAVIDEVVVIDATGAEVFRGMPSLDGDILTMTVPGAVLDRAAYPLTIDPTVSSGRGVHTTGYNPSIAFNGTDYMVVWQEPWVSESDLYAARLNTVGAIVTQRFGVATDGWAQTYPDISWNGQQFLVVFERRLNSATGNQKQYDVWGQRIGEVGGKIGDNFPIQSGSRTDRLWTKRHPSVTSNGLDWYVVWDEYRTTPTSGLDIWGLTVTRNGHLGIATALATTGVDETSPDVAWNGGTYLVAYRRAFNATDQDIFGQRVSPFAGAVLPDGTRNGAPLGTAIAIAAPNADQHSVGVASEGFQQLPCDSCADPTNRGTDFFVTWAELRGGDWDVIGTRVSKSGTLIDATSKVIAGSTRDEIPSGKSVAFNGAYFVAWVARTGTDVNTSGVFGTRVDTTGKVLDSPALTIQDGSQIERNPAVTNGDDGGWGVAYEGFAPDGTAGVVMRKVSPK